MDWTPFLVSLKLAAVVCALLPPLALPAAWALSKKTRSIKKGGAALAALEAFVNLPLAVPPTVLGFYLLVALSPASPLGSRLAAATGIRLAFSFEALVMASLVSCAPFMVQGLASGLRAIDPAELEASMSMGRGPLRSFARIGLPAMAPSAIQAIFTVFAHCLGEFGVVMMIGGAIPGKTETASIAIYRWVESSDYGRAGAYSGILLATAFFILFGVSLARRAGDSRAQAAS
jgi:molybdate transport system permease protein